MASLTREDNIDWFWGSLKPWQILHSTLAERERIGSPLGVWELVTETLGANTANSIRREDAMAVQEEDVDKGWAHRMKFLGDDGEFWRHGGVMESRVRDWLIKRHEEQELANHSFLPLSSGHHLHRHHDQSNYIALHNYSTSSELAIAYSSIAPVPQCNDSSATVSQLVAADRIMSDDEDQSSEESEAGDQEENAGVAVDEDDDIDDDDHGIHLATVEEEDYRDNYALISTNYDDHHGYTGFSTVGECRLVVNRCCGAAAMDHNDHDDLQVSATARSAAGPYLEEEMVQEEIEVCAVCLEKLNNDEEEEAVQALACRHLFHRDCIAPWLERQPHACCPCCRAPILAPPQLHLAAPLNVAASPPSSCSGNHHHAAARQRDIMGLLADMEAALERLGFRS